jgi:competence protein ComEC
VYALRHKLVRGLALSLPGDQAALAQALLLGIRSGIPQEMNEAFRNTGTSHILAISGLHVGVLLALLVGISVWLFGRRRNMYLLLPLIGVWLYVVLSGFSASAERSAVMATVYLAALALGRQQSVLPALALAAGVMAGVDPKTLKDISFQLSATAVAGIVLLGPLISRWIVGLSGGRLERTPTFGIVDGVATGVAATVATLPLLAFHFHRVSVVGVPATLLLLPALSIALVISTIAAAFGLVGGVVASVVGWIAYVPLAYMCGLVDLLARLPGASFSASANGLAVWLFYSMGMAVLLAPRFLRRYMGFRRDADEQGQTIQMIPQSRPVAIAIPVVLASAAFLFWMAALSAPDSRVHITFFDVGQSDSILIETPSGRQILIDGGSDPRKIAHHLGKRLPFWDRSLDAVVLTHPEEDHLAGLVEVAKRYELGIVFEGLGQKGKPLYQEWSEVLEERGVQVVWVRAGYRVPVEENIMLEVLGPPERAIEGSSATNDNSVVLRLVCGEVEFLLPGDIQQRGEWWLLESGQLLRSDVLKVAHHGSGMSSSSRFLAGVSPTVAVISVGDNTFGHPSEEVGSRLDEFNINVLTTKERGNIEMTTDGRQVWVRTEK